MATTITGTALVPGVSRNGRLYTKELIGKAVSRAQARIGEGRMPLTMLTHHDAEDDSTRIVGHLTHLEQADDGSARFKAVLADTDHAQTIGSLVRDGHLGGVSIRGAWIGELQRVQHEGRSVDTADDLELDGLDFTKNPGVPDARIDPPGRGGRESAVTRHPVTESVPMAMISETVEVDETATIEAGKPPKAPYGDVTYADPGYQKDKKKRYPLNNLKRAKAAWSYINQKDNAALYSPQQLKRVRQRIIKALKGFGVKVEAKEHLLIEQPVRVSEAVAESMGYDNRDGSYSITLTNGPTTVTVCSWCVDPSELVVIGRAAMDGACKALATLDPDMDGDVDVPGAPDADSDHDMEAAPNQQPPTAISHDRDPDGDDDDEPDDPDDDKETATGAEDDALNEGNTAVAKTTAESSATTETPQATPAGITFTEEQFQALLSRLGPAQAKETAPVEPDPTPEPVAAATETDEQRIARLVDEQVKARVTAAIQEQVERTGGPTRKGLVAPVNENTQPGVTGQATGLNEHGLPSNWPNKPLHQYTPEERARHLSTALMEHVVGARGAAQIR